MDYEIANVQADGQISDVEKRILDAYRALGECESQLDAIDKAIMTIEGMDISVCDAGDLVEKLEDVRSALSDTASSMTGAVTTAMSTASAITGDGTLTVSADVEKYLATAIILKKYQILKYKIEKVRLVVERKQLVITQDVLKWVADGKGSWMTMPIQAALGALSLIAATINAILSVLGTMLSLLNTIPVGKVSSASTALFMTPKSMKDQGITILNDNTSVTNGIPNVVDELITKAAEKITETMGNLKKSMIATASANSASSAESGSFEYSGIGDFDKFDPEIVKTAIKQITGTMLISQADALPRYEELKITNPRFLLYLAFGFEPKAKASFGIPGFP